MYFLSNENFHCSVKHKISSFIQTAVNHARQFRLISGQVSLFNPLALKKINLFNVCISFQINSTHLRLIILKLSRYNVVGIVTRLQAGRSGVLIATREKVVSKTSRTALVPTQPAMGTGDEQLGREEDKTHLHLVPRVTMSGAIPLLPPYVFTTCTGTIHIFS
jgi:hypothetical protein